MRGGLLTALTVIGLPNVVLAQEGRDPNLQPIEVTGERLPDAASTAETNLIQGGSEAYEEVVVIGDPTIGSLSEELRAAEDKVHELFNALNDDDEFDIHCHIEAPTGTRISRRVCKPNYVDTATRNFGQAYLNFLRGEAGGAAAPPRAVIQFKNDILREKLTELVKENAELREAVVRFGQLSSAFEGARQQILDSND